MSKYEYKQHYGGAAKSRFLADQCKCEIPDGPPMSNSQENRIDNPDNNSETNNLLGIFQVFSIQFLTIAVDN